MLTRKRYALARKDESRLHFLVRCAILLRAIMEGVLL